MILSMTGYHGAVWCLGVLILGSACASTAMQTHEPSQTPAVDLGPCPGTSMRVQAGCGCSPSDAKFLTRVRAFGFNESKIAEASQCAHARFSTSLAGMRTFGTEFLGCLEQKQVLDPEMKGTITRMVEAAQAETSSSESAAWLACYQRIIGVSDREEALIVLPSKVAP